MANVAAQSERIGISRANVLLLWAVAVPFFVQAIVFLVHLLRLLYVKNDTTYPEGVSVFAFVNGLRNGYLYSDPVARPYNAEMYGPVFYLLGRGCARLAGSGWNGTTILARWLALLSFAGSAVLSGLICWRLERRRAAAFVVCGLGLGCWFAVFYGATARADLPALFFTMLGVYLYLRAHGRAGFLLTAGVVLAAGIFTKQSMSPALLALLLDTLLTGKFMRSLWLGAGAALFAAGLLSYLTLRHEPFLANFAIIGKAVFVWPSLVRATLDVLLRDKAGVILLVLGVVASVTRIRDARYRPLILCTWAATAANLLAMGNVGGGNNYFLLPWMLLVALVPAGFQAVASRVARPGLLALGLMSLGAVLLIHDKRILAEPVPANLQPDTVTGLHMLSDVPYLEMQSRKPEMLDPYFYHQLDSRGVWSEAPIANAIVNGKYDLILLTGRDSPEGFMVAGFRGFSYWSAALLNEMTRSYTLLCEVPGTAVAPAYLAMVPKRAAGRVTPAMIARIFGEAGPCLATMRPPIETPGFR